MRPILRPTNNPAVTAGLMWQPGVEFRDFQPDLSHRVKSENTAISGYIWQFSYHLISLYPKLSESILTRDMPDALCHSGDGEAEGQGDPHDILVVKNVCKITKIHLEAGGALHNPTLFLSD